MTAHRTEAARVRGAPVAATNQLARIAEAVVRAGVPAVILTLPLEFTVQLFRLQLARILLLVVLLAFLYLVATRQRALTIPAAAGAALAAAYVAVSLLSWAVTRAPGSVNELLDVVAYPVTAVLIFNLVRDERDLGYAWNAFLASGLAIALLGAFLYVTHLSIWRPDLTELHRVNATFGDPNIAARFLILAVCAGIVLFAGRREPVWLAVAVVVAAAAVIPVTFSKSGYLVFPVAAVLTVPFGRDRRRAAAMGALALAVFAGSIFANPATRDRAGVSLGLVTGTTANGGSNPLQPGDVAPLGGGRLDSVRTYLIQAGVAMFEDHPATGVGFGGYQHALLTGYKRFLPQNPAGLVTLSHTSAVTILAEQGLVGAGLFAGFLLLVAWGVVLSLRRPTPWRDWIVLPALLLVPILVLSQFEGRLIEEPYFWLAIALLFAAKRLEGTVRTVDVTR